MKHISIPLNSPCELIEVTPINPLISKCQIKVCYVGNEPNRNGSVITKEVATEMANSIPGSPIVGYFNKKTKDFEEHNREMVIEDGELKFLDTTKPYGFVDLGARVWFQKFLDDGVEHEYLMTEGYLWTGQYPEAQRIIDKGNNQSMELDEKTLQAHWAEIEKDGPEFFIINEAIVSKLCILGEDYEPCFEGAQITKVNFSLEDNFKEELYSLMNQMKEILAKGGTQMDTEVIAEVTEEEVAAPAEETVETEPAAEVVEEEVEDTETETEEEVEEDPAVEEEIPEEEPVVEEVTEENEPEIEDKGIEYNLEEIQEYIELKNNYSVLENNYNELAAEITALREFKANVERNEKQAMIDKFYMLSDEEKKDVQENIDTYSLDEIEGKLSIICVRSGLGFEKETTEDESHTFNLNSTDLADNTPAWLKAVKKVQENM